MSLANIVSGDYGQTIQLTVLDTDTNAAADISGYSTAQTMTLRDPDGTSSAKVAAFATDGTNGVVEYTLMEGDIDIDQDGAWKVRVTLASGTAKLTSTWLRFIVLA